MTVRTRIITFCFSTRVSNLHIGGVENLMATIGYRFPTNTSAPFYSDHAQYITIYDAIVRTRKAFITQKRILQHGFGSRTCYDTTWLKKIETVRRKFSKFFLPHFGCYYYYCNPPTKKKSSPLGTRSSLAHIKRL